MRDLKTDGPPRILVVDDDPGIHYHFQTSLEGRPYRLDFVDSAVSAFEKIDPRRHFLAFIDHDLGSGDLDGVSLIRKITEKYPQIVLVMFSGGQSQLLARNALKAGAWDFMQKHSGEDVDLIAFIERAASEYEQRVASQPLSPKGHCSEIHKRLTRHGIAGRSSLMESLGEKLFQYAKMTVAVSIRGPSGAGKERIARTIHQESSRSDKPFVTVNCGAIPSTLIESILFGHEKGAFTGATSRRKGLFQQADGGTLFMDEIAELPLDQQVKLLRVLQEGEVVAIGANEPQKIDVRIVTATHKDLLEEVKAGRFREDLYYRIEGGHSGAVIKVPSLEERRDDIEPIALYVVENLARRRAVPAPKLTQGFVNRLEELRYPGNVRQLVSALEFAFDTFMLDDQATAIEKRHLPDSLQDDGDESSFDNLSAYDETQDEKRKVFFKKITLRAIQAVLEDGGRPTRRNVASHPLLGLSSSWFHVSMEKYGLNFDELTLEAKFIQERSSLKVTHTPRVYGGSHAI